MTLRDVMQSDVSGVFLVTTEHAETVRYRQKEDGVFVNATAIVDRGEGIEVTTFDDGGSAKLEATIYCQKSSPLDDVREASEFEFDNYIWRVSGNPLTDGAGMQTLRVVRFRHRERTAREYRLDR